MGRQIRGVDQQIRAYPDRRQQFQFALDALIGGFRGCQGMAAASLRIAAHQNVRATVEVDQFKIDLVVAAKRIDQFNQRGDAEVAVAHIKPQHQRPVEWSAFQQRGQQPKGQIIDGFAAKILKRANRCGASGARRPGHKHQLVVARIVVDRGSH